MLDLAVSGHARLRTELPFLPAGATSVLGQELARLADEGVAFGAFDEGRLKTFLGMLLIPGLRGATVGGLALEWACAATNAGNGSRDVGHLYRALAAELVQRDCRLHTVSVFATDSQTEEAFVQLGFGRFLANRASPVSHVRSAVGDPVVPAACTITPATAEHAVDLSRLHALLEAHLEASPVFLPAATGWSVERWTDWLRGESSIAFVASYGGKPVGYIKAQEPQFDVSYAVHGDEVLAINGMFVEPEHRGTGVAQALLSAVASEAERRGLTVLSVDHESANLEADSFWGRYFQPVSSALERRL